MRFPAWAPPELVSLHEELKPKAAEEEKRRKAHLDGSAPMKVYDPREALEDGSLHVGKFFLGNAAQLKVLEPLVFDKRMAKVWRSLVSRTTYKPYLFIPYGAKGKGGNLYGACMQVELEWHNLPRRTKAESKRYYESVAALAKQLGELLLQDDHNARLLDTRYYISESKLHNFTKALEADGHEIWYGFDGFLNEELGQLVQPLPYYLLQMHNKAKAMAAEPVAVKQPNSPSAKVNFYIDHLSAYFKAVYGMPLHANVATIVSVVLGKDVDEDRVRALLRSRKAATPPLTRKKS